MGGDESRSDGRWTGLGRVLHGLFGRHAERPRHAGDRQAYRATAIERSFETYVARTYALSWLVAVVGGLGGVLVGTITAPTLAGAVVAATGVGVGHAPAVVVGAVVGAGATKHATVRLRGRYLRWIASARRSDIRRTLPGAVRYLRALSTGSDDWRAMIRKLAANREAYGETAVACRKALHKASLAGSLDEGLRVVARDTPSRDTLAPFLLKFREHASQGPDALRSYLRMEGRMLSHRQARERDRAEGFLELLSELFIVLLVLPALLVIVLTVMSVLSPALRQSVATPLGSYTVRSLLVYASAGFVLVIGATASWLVDAMRPAGFGAPRHERPGGIGTLRTAAGNPASAVAVVAPVGACLAAGLLLGGYRPLDAVLAGYVTVAVPVGLVATRRARLDDAKDREIKDFVHAVSGHVGLGRPFPEAVAAVAEEVDLGALSDDVADLAFNLGLTTRPGDLNRAALNRFVERVGTPLARQTVGLVTGALDAGSDGDDVFDTLQTEVGRLYHEKRSLRSSMAVYVAVGWTTALLILGIVLAVDAYVLDGFAQLSATSTAGSGFGIAPGAIDPAAERRRFYVVTQATMLASGWFAGTASRGRYDALFHSGLLVAVAHVVFAGVGMT
ncbi:hypothetical protein BRD17_04060 [Halobacteriales archaeon SW_7_68_16]|nr:MAG: hypothetical protein BRD17_04060 [Halobacteriales archaeon SW_7_68_16]